MKNIIKLLIIGLFVGCILSCKRKGEEQIVYVPEGLKNTFIIVYNDKNGAQTEYSNKGERIYRIPKDGILYTQFSVNYGWKMSKAYYVDHHGNPIQEIKNFDYEEYHNNLNDNEIYQLDSYLISFSDKTGDDKTYLKNDTIDTATSTTDKGHIKCEYTTLGMRTDNRQELKKQASSLIDSISKYYPQKYIP